jgi:hypothetical protein
MSLQPYFQMVENCISALGVDPASCRGEQEGQWNLRRGSASVWVDVWNIEMEGGPRGYFQCMAPVVEIPADNQAAFFKELLEINHTLYGVAFTIQSNWAYIKMIREVEGLEEAEISAMLSRVGFYADDYDDKLQAKYGTVTGGRG